MFQINKNLKLLPAIFLFLVSFFMFTSCNKEFDKAGGEITFPPNGTTPTLATLLDASDMTILKAAVTKAGLLPSLSNTSLRFTLFAPNDAAMTSSGISLAVINALSVSTVTSLMQYHVVPQVVSTASIPTTFPNLQYPTLLNPAPALSALLRLTTFPSRRANGIWVNNIPITVPDIQAVNGVMHKVALVVSPPSRYVYDRINTDADLSIFKAAIIRADEGLAPTSPTSIIGVMNNIGANLTVYAPSNQAFKNLISALTMGMIPTNAPDATYISFLASNNVTTQTVRGIVVYHITLSRAFTNNIPITALSIPTFLNLGIPSHPGITIASTFTGPSVSAATVKGVANATASNIAINPTPDPAGTSDQHFLNGVIHKIDQVLLPQ
ncbi:MAG: fasciclin domain-containing protein [Chitinophagaceae bacterium]